MSGRHRICVAGVAAAAAASAVSTGCGRAPAFNIMGSFFPGWLACIVVSILLAVGVHLVLSRYDLERRLKALLLFYVSLTLLFACTLWLLLFE